jgi:malate permease and related proteins
MLANTVLRIFVHIILPVFVLIGVGVLVDRTLHVDLASMSRLCFRVFLPALIVVKLVESDIAWGQMQALATASLVHLGAMAGLAYAVFSRSRPRNRRLVLSLGAVVANCGNFGIPLADLAFPGSGAGVLAVLLMVQNLLTFSVGIYLIERLRGGSHRSSGQVLSSILRMPVLHAIILGLVLRVSGSGLVPQLDQPLRYLAGALVPMALITLGVQLSRCRVERNVGLLTVAGAMRLVVSPIVAVGIVHVIGLQQPYANIFVLAAGLPVAVNVYILAAEYDLDSALASQSILWTTLGSALTLSVILAIIN